MPDTIGNTIGSTTNTQPQPQPQSESYDPELDQLHANFAKNSAWAKPGPYTTPLSPMEETQFRGWVQQNKIPYHFDWPEDQSKQDYDMRGYWKAQQMGDPNAKQDPGNKHFPDTWKTPYHESFSNLSQYATPAAPSWKGKKLIGQDGTLLFQAK